VSEQLVLVDRPVEFVALLPVRKSSITICLFWIPPRYAVSMSER